ncbi:MAG: hypothetical protein A2V84_04745 [Chloroflexi bacterium RBG_16_70_13]|nr:MAG: hypothetical protein A2V84_04745 [Chloroflexi bacterium RBG_16_70_13]
MQHHERPNWFAAGWFAQFMTSGLGRRARVVAGFALIAFGLVAVGGTPGVIVAAIGLVPLLAGTFDVCVFSPIFGGPLAGAEIRACARR